MPDHLRIPLQTAAARAAAAGHPVDERDGLAILLEALRLSAERGISVAEGAVCIDAEGKLSFRPHGLDLRRRDPGAQVRAACALADALFRGTSPLPLEPATFPTLDHLIVAAELRVMRAGDARLATQSEARRAAAALFARASEAAGARHADSSEVITDKLPFPEGATARAAGEDAPLLSQIPGLAERDLHRDAVLGPEATAETDAGQEAARDGQPEIGSGDPGPSRPRASAELESPVAKAIVERAAPEPLLPERSFPASGAASGETAPAEAAALAPAPSSSSLPGEAPPPIAPGRERWMIPTALLLAGASAFPFARRPDPNRAAPSAPPAREEARPAEVATPPPSAAPVRPAAKPTRANARTAARSLEEGERAFQEGHYYQAIIAFRRALEGPSPVPIAAKRLGDVYALQDDPELAAAAWRQYLQLAPDSPDAAAVQAALEDLEEP